MCRDPRDGRVPLGIPTSQRHSDHQVIVRSRFGFIRLVRGIQVYFQPESLELLE